MLSAWLLQGCEEGNMGEMEPVEVGILVKIYDALKKHGPKAMDRILSIAQKKHRVLVLGSSGVGKTMFLLSLTADNPDPIKHYQRTLKKDHKNIPIRDLKFRFTDTPGQEENERRAAIRESINTMELIINVVCYGYHAYSLGKSKAIDKNGQIIDGYLQAHRELEISAMNEWTQLLGGNAPYRLVTVVTKADFWWDRQNEVLEYYTNGAYAQALGDAKSLNPEVAPYCSTFHKLYDVGSLSGNFDSRDQQDINSEFQNMLTKLVK